MASMDHLDIQELVSSRIFWMLAGLMTFASVLIARLLSNVLPKKTPPVFEGIPYVGGLLKFLSGPIKLMTEGFEKHGEVFTVPVLHLNITFLIGPNVSLHFFKASDSLMSQKEVYEFNVPTFGPGVVYDVDTKVRNEQYRMFGAALKSEKLREYLPLFRMEANEFFSKYADEGEVDLMEAMANLVMLTAARTLLGREIRETMFEDVSKMLHMLDEGMLPISVLFPYLPITAHKNRDVARAQLAEIFTKVLKGRRESGVREPDLLQTFMDSKYEKNFDGRALTDSEIGGLLIAALFAGQHTSSITSAWTGYQLIHNKEWWDKVVDEQKRVIATYGLEDSLGYDALNDMPVLHNCIREALRLNPPLILVLRKTHSEFTVTTRNGKDIVVPKGHIVAASPTFSHRLPYVFKNPDSFEPDRFEPPRQEDAQAPFSYIAFGGGRHSCMGHNFALLQIKVIWSTVIRTFEMKPVDDLPKPDYHAMVVGPLPSRVSYKRRSHPIA